MKNVQEIPTGLLVQEYREMCLMLGKTNGQKTADLSKKVDQYEEEILRRMAW